MATMITDFTSYLFQHTREAEAEVNRIHEPVIGIVTDIRDEQKLCHIKVKIPTLPIAENTYWCTWISIGGGKDRGWFSLPEVDDEVLIAFEHGEINRPIVLGALWNGKDKAPDNNSDGKDARRKWKSKSGHTITLEDDAGFIEMKDGAGIGTVKIDAKGNSITVTAAQGDVSVKCKDEFAVVAGEIAITAKGSCTLSSSSGGTKASATATVKIDGQMVALKGSTIDVNPGGVPQADKASGDVATVADPVKG
jgi:phage baseplate assembly protein V